eukprot:59568-Chlamydomonas_euryale.AAC.2
MPRLPLGGVFVRTAVSCLGAVTSEAMGDALWEPTPSGGGHMSCACAWMAAGSALMLALALVSPVWVLVLAEKGVAGCTW